MPRRPLKSSGFTGPFRGRSAVRSGLLTGVSTLAVSVSAGIAGALLARKFGRDAETDGFLAAYGIYLVLALAAQAFRVVVVPDLTRAAAAGRLAPEVRAYLLAFLALAAPVSALVAAFSGALGDGITGSLPHAAGAIAGRALVWLVPAAFGQLFGALAASALAARDDYGVAAFAYAAGGAANVAVFVALADSHGLIALAWGGAVNGAIVTAVPLLVLATRGGLLGGRIGRLGLRGRLWRLAQGATVPIALQGLYIVALRFAADLGVGRVTSFSYAYLIAAVLVAATASSVALISSAPLTRRGLDAESAAAHVVHSSWLSLALIAAAAGVFGLVGGRVAGGVLGHAYSGDVGRELGRLVVYLAPWMIAAVAYSVTYPLVFVMEKGRRLVPLALAAVALHVPLAFGLREAFGLPGISIALAISTFAVLGGLLVGLSPRMLALAGSGIARLALVTSAVAAVSFGALSLVLGGFPGAAVGLLLYAALLLALRPRGLRDAWAYVRALHRLPPP